MTTSPPSTTLPNREFETAKVRSRKTTAEDIQQAIVRLQENQIKVSISSVAKAAGVTPALIHNTYPAIAEQIRTLIGKATRAQRDAKHEAVIREREINRALRSDIAALRADVAKLASINQVLMTEVAVLKGMASGKLVSILRLKQPDV